jgi:imidazolonepropionase-like amidohydrolase
MAPNNDLLITNARLIDGTGAAPVDNQSLLVKDGRIVEIGADVTAANVRAIDAAGATVLPGLIDGHVHLESVPGSYFRDDSDEQLWAHRRHQLQAYLACGVTTVLDNGISSRQLREFQQHLAGGGVGPQIYALAPIFYPPGGYGDALVMRHWGPFSSSASAADVDALFREYEGLDNIIGAKMTIEPGMGPSQVWEIHTAELRDVIADQAARRGLPVHTHALKPSAQLMALQMGVYCLAHAGFFRDAPTQQLIDEVKQKGIYVTTTLASTMDGMLVQYDPGRLDDPLIRLTVPSEQIATARDPEAWKATLFTMLRVSFPEWMPDFLVRFFQKIALNEKALRAQLESSSRAILQMHGAGIPIVAGTDTANWPIFISFFHGPSTIRELELLRRAGMAPMDVLCSATRIPAEMMRQADEIGTVEVGKRADLIVAPDDPLEDLAALRRLSWSIQAGVARTPEEWMRT